MVFVLQTENVTPWLKAHMNDTRADSDGSDSLASDSGRGSHEDHDVTRQQHDGQSHMCIL